MTPSSIDGTSLGIGISTCSGNTARLVAPADKPRAKESDWHLAWSVSLAKEASSMLREAGKHGGPEAGGGPQVCLIGVQTARETPDASMMRWLANLAIRCSGDDAVSAVRGRKVRETESTGLNPLNRALREDRVKRERELA